MKQYRYYDKLYSKMNIWEEIEWHKFLNSFNKKETDIFSMYDDFNFINFYYGYCENDIDIRVKDIFKNYNK